MAYFCGAGIRVFSGGRYDCRNHVVADVSEMTQHGIVLDLRQAAKVMAETGTFPTGQAIMRDAADEIERLRDQLVRMHTDRPFVVGFNQGWDAAVENEPHLLKEGE